jgi:hypothetical protein
MSYDLPICPTGCNAAPPVQDFNDCNPEVYFGPIEYVYLGRRGNPLTDWTDAADWASRIDNTGTTGDEIRQLRVIAEWAEPESNIKIISGNRRITGPKTFTVSGEIDETSLVNYEALRMIECGGNFSVWLETSNSSGKAGKLFGDNDGIEGFVMENLVIQRDENEHHRFMFTITWTSQFHPKSIISPIVH